MWQFNGIIPGNLSGDKNFFCWGLFGFFKCLVISLLFVFNGRNGFFLTLMRNPASKTTGCM